MKQKRSMLAVLAMAAVLIAGCSRGQRPIKDPGGGAHPDSDFCKTVKQFRIETLGLNATLATDPKTAATLATQAQSDLQSAQAKLTGEPVFGVGVKVSDDLKTVAGAFGTASNALARVRPGDIKGYSDAVSGANSPLVDQASSRLDGYTTQECGISPRGLPAGLVPSAGSTSTTSIPGAPGPLQGPTGPSTTAGGASTPSSTK